MKKKDIEDDSNLRIDKLVSANLIHYLNDIDVNDEVSFYDSVIFHLLSGQLEDDFYAPSLNGKDEAEKKYIHNIIRKYSSLCFFRGNPSFWKDSVDGVKDDLDFVCMKVLDNYNFLYELYDIGKEDILKEVTKYINSMDMHGSVIEGLRNSFSNDIVLKLVLLEMSKKNGRYNNFNVSQRAILLNNPLGTIFKYDDKKHPIINPTKELERDICTNLGLEDRNYLPNISNEVFNEVVTDMVLEYQDMEDNKKRK